jgi:hypothetical protein
MGASFYLQRFATKIPEVRRQRLLADGRIIPCVATSFVSGRIESNYQLLSSLISSQKFLYEPNINFNPRSRGISRSNHYFAPSVAVARAAVPKLLRAKKVLAEVVVRPRTHTSENILVGNRKNPNYILFCHYDSLGPGASDNASGTAVLLSLIARNSELLTKALFVFAGNEELSYDQPIYWGHGYRVFEQRFAKQLRGAKKIVVLDSLAHGRTCTTSDPHVVRLGFPIKDLLRLQKKITMVYGDFDKLMEVYHSSLDLPSNISPRYLAQAISLTQRLLS